MIAGVGPRRRVVPAGPRVARPEVDRRVETYADQIAARLRELRHEKGWSIQDFRLRLAQVAGVTGEDGEPIPQSTAYSYEHGRSGGGADLPTDLFPAIALLYGYATPFGWLPKEWPHYLSK